MSQSEAVRKWTESAVGDWQMAKSLRNSGKYAYALFFVQMALEKYFKALIIKKTDDAPPVTHDIAKLARLTGFKDEAITIDDLIEITSFNVEARYDVYKERLFKKATQKYTDVYLDKIERIIGWIKNNL